MLFVKVPLEMEAIGLLPYPAKDFVLEVGGCDDPSLLQVPAVGQILVQRRGRRVNLYSRSHDLVQVDIGFQEHSAKRRDPCAIFHRPHAERFRDPSKGLPPGHISQWLAGNGIVRCKIQHALDNGQSD
jgi:hypothetical protein